MSSPAVPLKSARIAALSIAWSWAIVSSSTGLNALIKSNRSKSALKAKVPPPTRLDIDVSDANNSGIVLTTGSVLIGILTYHMIVGMFFPATRNFVNRTLRAQAWLLTFCCVWLFACAVPFTYIFANHSAKVRAFIGATELPSSVIEAMQKQSGTSAKYSTLSYLRLVAIFPWITLLFTAIAAFVLFKASNHVSEAPILANESVSSAEEKATEQREERVEEKV